MKLSVYLYRHMSEEYPWIVFSRNGIKILTGVMFFPLHSGPEIEPVWKVILGVRVNRLGLTVQFLNRLVVFSLRKPFWFFYKEENEVVGGDYV